VTKIVEPKSGEPDPSTDMSKHRVRVLLLEYSIIDRTHEKIPGVGHGPDKLVAHRNVASLPILSRPVIGVGYSNAALENIHVPAP
jgi:hypothetical protein